MRFRSRKKRTSIAVKRVTLLVVCFAVAILTTYRVHLWLSHYTKLASKMMISAYDEQQTDLPFPLVTVCNINPARGSELYNAHSTNPVTRGLDYELFSDAYQGRFSENAPETKLRTPVYRLMDHASHKLKDMLKSCTVDQKRCYAANFTKSILPTGACYTFNGMTTAFDEFQLTLDPQSFDYLIPSQGFVGFRVLLHSRGDPLWAMVPSAVYTGPTFHTMLRVVGLKKIYKQQCVTQRQWARCIHQCMQDMLHKRCQCHLSDCTLINMMRCGIRMNAMVEILPPNQCNCQNPCEQVTYSIESITQALKAPLFAQSTGIIKSIEEGTDDHLWQGQTQGQVANRPYNTQSFNEPTKSNSRLPSSLKGLEEHKREIKEGTLIQTWAFLREANRTAFEHLRQLSRLLQSLHMDLQTVERAVTSVQLKQPQISGSMEAVKPYDWQTGYDSSQNNMLRADNGNGLCMDAEEHGRILSRVRNLGEEFVRLFRQSVLFRDVPQMPGHDLHVHLVRLFFLRVVPEFDRLANQLQHNDLFSDVTMLDLQRKANQCKQSAGSKPSGSARMSNTTSRMLADHVDRIHLEQASEDIASLQAVLLATDSQFKQLRSSFIKLTQENRDLIETVSLEQLKLGSGYQPVNSFVTMTIQLTRDKNRLVRLESVQTIYNPLTELIDLIVSGLVMAFLAIFLLDICTSHRTPDRSLICCANTSVSTIEEPSPNKPSLIMHTGCEPLTECMESSICHPAPALHSPSEFYKTIRPSVDRQKNNSNFSRLCTLCPVCASSDWPMLSGTTAAAQSNASRLLQPNTTSGHCMHQTQALCEQSQTDCASAVDTDSGKPSSATTHPSSIMEFSTSTKWDQAGASTSRSNTLKCGLFLESPTYLVPSSVVSSSMFKHQPIQPSVTASIRRKPTPPRSLLDQRITFPEGSANCPDNGCRQEVSDLVISPQATGGHTIFFPLSHATGNSMNGSYDGGGSSGASTTGGTGAVGSAGISEVGPYDFTRVSVNLCKTSNCHNQSTSSEQETSGIQSFFTHQSDDL